MFTTDELVTRFRVSRRTLYRWARDGRLQAVKIGHRLLFPATEVEKAIAANRLG